MNTLKNIENLLEHLTGKLKAVINERGEMLAEITSLRGRIAEIDKDAVKAAQDMKTELEAVKLDALRSEQERISVNAKLQSLNDRLIALVSDKNRCGG